MNLSRGKQLEELVFDLNCLLLQNFNKLERQEIKKAISLSLNEANNSALDPRETMLLETSLRMDSLISTLKFTVVDGLITISLPSKVSLFLVIDFATNSSSKWDRNENLSERSCDKRSVKPLVKIYSSNA